MQLPLFQVDAFEEGPFTGNPAAVVPLEEPIHDGLMQQIAEENNLSETAFTAPIPDAEGDAPTFALRWFTPTTEVDLCGHATLGAAAALRDLGALDGATQVHFSTRSGPLTASLGGGDQVEIDLPAAVPTRAPGPDQLDAIERALFTFGLAPVGRTADEVYAATYKRMEVPRGRPPRRDMGRYGEIWGVARLNIIWI